MIIYIYGTDSFKREIHYVLNHSNIKFRLNAHDEIIDLKTLNQLKDAIADNPDNIYLIDDSKIIRKNTLQEKIKFFKPKDGIKQEYLLDHGIGDISVDSMDELSKHIIKKLESVILENESNDIQESIVEIVEDAYIELDSELGSLLSHRDLEKDDSEFLNTKDEHSSLEIVGNIQNSLHDDYNEDLYFDKNLDNIEEKVEMIIDEPVRGDNMADDFSEFNSLDENEIMTALDGMNDNIIEKESIKQSIISACDNSTKNIDMDSSNVDDIAKLISQLLNNKTLEITVKVKN